MLNGLPSLRARIEDNAITGLGDALRQRNLVRLPGNLGHQPVARRRKACQVSMVQLRDDQHVNRCLRIDVTKCKRALCFEYASSRDLPCGDSAE